MSHTLTAGTRSGCGETRGADELDRYRTREQPKVTRATVRTTGPVTADCRRDAWSALSAEYDIDQPGIWLAILLVVN